MLDVEELNAQTSFSVLRQAEQKLHLKYKKCELNKKCYPFWKKFESKVEASLNCFTLLTSKSSS